MHGAGLLGPGWGGLLSAGLALRPGPVTVETSVSLSFPTREMGAERRLSGSCLLEFLLRGAERLGRVPGGEVAGAQ